MTDALTELRNHLAASREVHEACLGKNNPFDEAGTKGVVYEAEARVRWIEEVFSLVCDAPTDDA